MNKVLRVVGLVQVVFGVLTVGYSALMLLSPDASTIVWVSLIVLGSLSGLTGLLLLKASRLGWPASVALQLVQVPAFSIGSSAYELGLGAFLTLGAYLPDVGATSVRLAALINFGLGAGFRFAVGAFQPEQYVAVNFVALAVLIGLLRNRPGRASGT